MCYLQSIHIFHVTSWELNRRNKSFFNMCLVLDTFCISPWLHATNKLMAFCLAVYCIISFHMPDAFNAGHWHNTFLYMEAARHFGYTCAITVCCYYAYHNVGVCYTMCYLSNINKSCLWLQYFSNFNCNKKLCSNFYRFKCHCIVTIYCLIDAYNILNYKHSMGWNDFGWKNYIA